jgi:type IV pilus assembly protein PilV
MNGIPCPRRAAPKGGRCAGRRCAGGRCARGFSLIEVLVALVIIAVGMLGLAKIQALAYASTGTASLRSLAAIEAASLAANMRAGRGYWASAPANLVVTITATSVSATDSTLNSVPNANASGCAYPSVCTSGALAAFDLQTWAGFLASGFLPNPTASISCPTPAVATTPIGCTITVSWTEHNAAINDQGTAANASAAAASTTAMAAPTYTLYVEP